MSSVTRSDEEEAPVVLKTGLPAQLLHDLRSPLNQIIGYSELLREEVSGQRREAYVRDLERIREAGQRMLAIIQDNFVGSGESSQPFESFEEEELLTETGAVRSSVAAPTGLLLVVDDDAMNRDVLSRRLTRQGHRVETANSGREAMAKMKEVPFDLVLLDIMMPDMDGYEALTLIKADESLQHVPVVMISALNDVQSVARCIEAGAEDYLTKPFNPTLLRARIGACLEKKRGRDRETGLFEQLQANYQKLQEVEKLRDDMRNMIVHDLRTPLTSVIVGVEMLAKHGQLNPEQQEMMSIAVGGGKTLLGMINDLLDVEKMESGTVELQYGEISPRKLVEAAVAQVASLAEEAGAKLVLDLEPTLTSFRGDESKLSRTLVNLIANAIRFTPAGTITITARREDDDIRFSVRDTGEGIPAEAFERIFEKFSQLDSHNKVGTGLGLAFCKLTVEAHGGHIAVESTPGSGSTFWFVIPIEGGLDSSSPT